MSNDIQHKYKVGQTLRLDLHEAAEGQSFEEFAEFWSWKTLTREEFEGRYLDGVVNEQDIDHDEASYNVYFPGHDVVHNIYEGCLTPSPFNVVIPHACPTCHRAF